MTYRNVDYLAESPEFKQLIEKYNFEIKIVDNEKLFIKSKCLLIEIFGFCTEDIFYFEIYSLDFKKYTNLDRLQNERDRNFLLTIYQKVSETITKPSIKILQSHYKTTLKAEQDFYSNLEIMKNYLSDIFYCKKQIDENLFSDSPKLKDKELRSLFGD